ncbi:MAG: hypothetical protein IJW26_04420, partial [Clostridia bacterium]|nr:hypothetical protein [Clostridia bacterium]
MAENNNKQQAILSIRDVLKNDKSFDILSDLKVTLKSVNKKIIDKKQALEKERKEKEKQVETVVQPEVATVVETQPQVSEPVVEETKVVEKQDKKKSTKKVEEVVQEVAVETQVVEETPKKASENNDAPVIQKTDNPNIVIINGKRVFVPNAKPAVKDTQKGGARQDKRTFVPQNNNQGQKKRDNAQGDRPDRKQGQFNDGRPQQSAFTQAPTTYVPKESNVRQSKKKNVEKNNYEDKKAINKKSLIKGQMSIDDFDENKTGYRKVR